MQRYRHFKKSSQNRVITLTPCSLWEYFLGISTTFSDRVFTCFLCCPSQNNFLQAFPSVSMPKKVGGFKTTSAGCLLGLWLKLLVNVSFAEDGQQSILRVTGALELLADLAQHRRHALLTLHNLCFCPANKPHVIANGRERSQWLNFIISYRDMKVLKQQNMKREMVESWFVFFAVQY